MGVLGAVFASLDEQQMLQCHVASKQQAMLFQSLDVFKFDPLACNFTVRVINQQQLDQVQQVSQCIPLEADFAKMSGHGRRKRSIEAPLSPDRFFADYQSYRTMRLTLAEWADQNPGIATFIPSVGRTHEGREMFAFKITSATAGIKKGIWFNGGQHAREWIAPATVIYLIHKLLVEAETPRVKALLDGVEFHFTPLANPDGYEYSRLPGKRLWRKNRRDNGDGSFGVDLNRNWDEHWGVVDKASSPSFITYRGPYPHSEPEVQALANYSLSIPSCYGGIDFHSYGQLILRNWGWSTLRSSIDANLVELSQLVQEAFKARGDIYTVKTLSELYPASGTLTDWMATKAKLVSLSIELCPSDYSYAFKLPAASIVSCSEGAYAAALAFSEYILLHPNIPADSTPIQKHFPQTSPKTSD
ncbi:hypothetical protein DSO57_1031187 [Entomophthora muscae]|uniref:Uncharacterized protein n=1 Tax=Entomophthora muscae TaxID=34485 RepID=A0ACC2T0T9_9FUNG|nr:hypothetical protein DSO57_1031187 [Entomophthora muscae]